MIKKKLQQELSRVSRENKNLLKERDTSSDIDNHRWATIIKLGTQIDKLQAENKELKEQQLTEDELLFIITPKGLPPLPKHIRLAKKIIAKMKEKAE